MGDIARKAGVTQPLVNHHFGTKKGLFQAVLHSHFEALEAALLACETATAKKPTLVRLRALIRTWVAFCGERPDFTRTLRNESHSELAREVNQRWQMRFVDFFEARLARARREGVISQVEPHFLFFAITGVATELFAQADLARRAYDVDPSRPEVIEAAAEFACDFILRGVGARNT